MSRMLRTNDCVPAGELAQLIAGEVPSPGATPSAAWLNLTGIAPPSGNPVTVNVIAGPPAAGGPPRCPACAAIATGIAIDRMIIDATNHRPAIMLFLLDVECGDSNTTVGRRGDRFTPLSRSLRSFNHERGVPWSTYASSRLSSHRAVKQ